MKTLCKLCPPDTWIEGDAHAFDRHNLTMHPEEYAEQIERNAMSIITKTTDRVQYVLDHVPSSRQSDGVQEKDENGNAQETIRCILSDSVIIAEIKGLFVDAITLLLKYRELEYAAKLKLVMEKYRQHNATEMLKNVLILRDIVALIYKELDERLKEKLEAEEMMQ